MNNRKASEASPRSGLLDSRIRGGTILISSTESLFFSPSKSNAQNFANCRNVAN